MAGQMKAFGTERFDRARAAGWIHVPGQSSSPWVNPAAWSRCESGDWRCSGGKSQKQVKKLVGGPSAHVCDESIDLCNEILAEE